MWTNHSEFIRAEASCEADFVQMQQVICDEKERAHSPTDNTGFVILNFLTIVVKYFLDNDPLTYYVQNLPESFQSILMAWKKKIQKFEPGI